MAIGRTNAGGGGTSLNFKVVGGTTQPTSPKENTIWVKTNLAIAAYELGKVSSPTWSMKKGFVYITIAGGDNTGGKNFNVIKETGKDVYVSVARCIQNQDGTKTGWERMDAYIYNSGKWVQFSAAWNGEIYDSGMFYFPFVKTDSNNYGGYTKTGNEGATKGSVTFGASNITMNVYEEPAGNNSIQFFGSNNPIDLSDWNTLKVEFSALSVTKGGTNDEGNWVCVAASPEKAFPGTGSGAAYEITYSGSGAAIISVDISNLDAAYVVVTGREYSSSTQIDAKVVKMWLE